MEGAIKSIDTIKTRDQGPGTRDQKKAREIASVSDTSKAEEIKAYFADTKELKKNSKLGAQDTGPKESIWHKEVWGKSKGSEGEKKESFLHKEIKLFGRGKNLWPSRDNGSGRQKPNGRAQDRQETQKPEAKNISAEDPLIQAKPACRTGREPEQNFWKKEVRIWPGRGIRGKGQGTSQNQEIPKRSDLGAALRSDLKEEKQAKSKDVTKTVKKIGKSKTEPRKSKAVFVRVAKRTGEILAFSAAFVLLLSSAAVFAYQDQYKYKALYGTKIFGEDVGGKTKNEIQNILNKKIAGISLNFEIDGQVITSTPTEAGVEFNASGSADDAITKGKVGKLYQKWAYAASSLIYKISPKAEAKVNGFTRDNLEIRYNINDEKLMLFAQGLSAKFNMDSKNAGLVMNGTEVTVIPAVSGRKIVADNIKYQIQEAIKKTETNKIQIAVEKVNPAILEKDTAESINGAKKLLNIPVSYHYQGQNFTPDKATVGGWVIFNTQDVGGKQKLVPAIDSKRVFTYIYGLGSKINVPAINKKVTIENGAKQTVAQEGKDGLAVDVDRASVTTATSMNSGSSVNLELPTYVVKFRTQVNNILVANWDKYIEINLSTQTLNAYTAGGNLVGSWRICSGKSGFATPTGTHLVVGKSSWIRMTGMQGTSEYYNLYPIKWATWFTGAGHAMHDAYWRGGRFGFPASHGCVNMPDAGASFIYNWAPVGTPVIVHY